MSRRIFQTLPMRSRESIDLGRIGWPATGYSLFDYAIVPGENADKYYFASIESNCLIATRQA